MEVVLAIVSGALYAAGVYMLLRRSIVKLVIGLVLLGHATNVLIFSLGRVTRGAVPIVAEGAEVLPAGAADPLPQALILTAIVIGFGLQAFVLMLVRALWAKIGTDDMSLLRSEGRLEDD